MDRTGIIDLLRELGAKNIRASSKYCRCSCLFAPWLHDGGTDEDPSMSVFYADTGRSAFNCFTCKTKGSLTSMLKRLAVFGHPSAAEMLGFVSERESGNLIAAMPRVLAKYNWEEEKKEQERVWSEKELKPFTGSVPRYAITRGVQIDTCKSLELGYDKKAPRFNIQKRMVWDTRRLVFPVRRRKDNALVGLVGRALEDGIKPRYHNYWNFDKRRYLYGEHLVELPFKHLLVVEGMMDMAKLMSLGIRNVVALMGSYPSEEQIAKLKMWCIRTDLYVMLDGNRAGRLGMKFLEENLRGQVRLHTIGLEDGLEPEHLRLEDLSQRMADARLIV